MSLRQVLVGKSEVISAFDTIELLGTLRATDWLRLEGCAFDNVARFQTLMLDLELAGIAEDAVVAT